MGENNKLGRRGFLSKAGLAMAGYSIIAKIPAASAQTADANILKKIETVNAEAVKGGAPNEPGMRQVDLSCDVLVAGGGLAGVCAAISAARCGMKVVFCQDRSRLGGNASSEIKMHPLGVHPGMTGFREGGIIEELKLECAANNPQNAWEIWDASLYDKVVSEPNITLLLDAPLFKVETENDEIKTAWVRCDISWQIYKVKAKIFIDCTGDARIAHEAGADVMLGREGVEKYGESNADYDTPGTCMGSSILFTAKQHDKPMRYKAPAWAKKITPEMLKFRNIGKNNFDYGYWWIELGGMENAVYDNEKLRFELLSVVFGIWDYIKNSGKYPDAENWALQTVGMVPGRRDGFRVVPEFLFTQQGVYGDWKTFKDNVCVGGWSMDDHPKEGFYASDERPCRQDGTIKFYDMPLGSLYSAKIKNLFMAGRNAGCSHVAFTTTRVMVTCAVMGQAVGTAAALCIKEGKTPSQLRNDPKLMKALQQRLLKDDQTVIGLKNEDPADLARSALAKASESTNGTSAQNILNGYTYELKEDPKAKIRPAKNRWIAPVASKPWIELAWGQPQKISNVQITFDSGARSLAQAAAYGVYKNMILGPQPEVIKDFKLIGILPDGSEKILAEVEGNYQRLVRFSFAPVEVKSLRLKIQETNGAEDAAVFEIRCYA